MGIARDSHVRHDLTAAPIRQRLAAPAVTTGTEKTWAISQEMCWSLHLLCEWDHSSTLQKEHEHGAVRLLSLFSTKAGEGLSMTDTLTCDRCVASFAENRPRWHPEC